MDSTEILNALTPFLEGEELSPAQITAISMYFDLLLKWNARMNLTSVRKPDEILSRHFGESLFAGRKLFPGASEEASLIDVGSGAGFPGLPVAVVRPKLRVTLLEAHGKKATFLREVVRALGLGNVKVRAERAEDLEQTADVVTLRAVEDFRQILPVCAELVRRGGRLAAFIGSPQTTVIKQLIDDSWAWSDPVYFPGSSRRALLTAQRL